MRGPGTGLGDPGTGPGDPGTGPGVPGTGPGVPGTGPGDPGTSPGVPRGTSNYGGTTNTARLVYTNALGTRRLQAGLGSEAPLVYTDCCV